MVVRPLENMQRTSPRTVGVYPDRSQIPIEDPNPVGTRSGRVGSLTFPDLLVRRSVIETFPSFSSGSSAAAPFAQENLSILLDTQALEEQDHAEISPFAARLPLHSPNAVSLKAKLRIER